MLQALRQFLSGVAKFFTGIFLKQAVTPLPSPPPAPIYVPPPPPLPTPTLTPSPLPPPPPVPSPFTQSAWWHGRYALTQAYGCSDFAGEGHNPLHPECPYFHEGEDYGLPMRTPIYAGYDVYASEIDAPGYLGAN